MKIQVILNAETADDWMKISMIAAETLGFTIGAAQAAPATGGVVPNVPPTAGQAYDPAPPMAPVAPVLAETPGLAAAAAPLAPAPVTAHDFTDLDADGIPWDARIHQASKGKTVKNIWKIRKNLNKDTPGLLEQVKAELKSAAPVAAVPLAAPPAAPGAPPRPTPPAGPALDPAHQAIIDQIGGIMANPPVRTVNALAYYELDESLDTAPAVMAFLQLFGCSNVDQIASVPEQWESIANGLNYIWPQ